MRFLFWFYIIIILSGTLYSQDVKKIISFTYYIKQKNNIYWYFIDAKVKFSDGNVRNIKDSVAISDINLKNKLTLNCKINDFPISVILPTSKYGNHYYSNPINLKDCVIINQGESKYFNAEKTILDLKNIVKEEEYIIKEAYEDGFLIKLGPLEEHLCLRLEQAIKNSELLEQYVINELLCKN